MSISVLDREMFSEAEAARLLTVNQSTLHWWLDGGTFRNKTYKPVIRLEPKGERTVTWAEFVEAALLRQYRREHNVPLAELRAVIDSLRDQFQVPYPLAHYQPFIGEGRRLVLEAQQDAGLDANYALVAVANNQLILTAPSQSFIERIEWNEDIASSWRPHDDPRSPIRMSPDVRFGLPSVKGIKTEVLWEQVEEGASYDEVAEMFDIEVVDVRWAHMYEMSLRAA